VGTNSDASLDPGGSIALFLAIAQDVKGGVHVEVAPGSMQVSSPPRLDVWPEQDL
jgi:hypothetical protein